MNSKLASILVLSLIRVNILGCHSRGIDVTIRNHGQAAVHNLEFDYPGAAFGIGSIAPGASFSYRIKPLSGGEVTLSFEQDGKTFQQKGPAVRSGEDGRLTIIIEQDSAKQWRMRAEHQ